MNAGVTGDIDGQGQPRGSAPDLGADEWITPQYVYVPAVLRD